MDQILGQILRQAVWERLDMLDALAANADGPSLASVARTELPRMTDGWRTLLRAHQPDERGNCPSCSTRWRPQKAPCSVWQAAHQHLVAPEQAAPAARRWHGRAVNGRAVPAQVHPVRRAALR